jgi:hypothetical protein
LLSSSAKVACDAGQTKNIKIITINAKISGILSIKTIRALEGAFITDSVVGELAINSMISTSFLISIRRFVTNFDTST